MNCRWMSDDGQDICTNADCPYCCDFCPVTENQEVCKMAEDFVRCERCGDLVYYDTAFYCDNDCKSRVNGNHYDVVFCDNCASDKNTSCPVCGEKKIGR